MQQRLDQIEDEFETVKQLLMSAARYAESANEKIDLLTDKQNRTQEQLDQLSGKVNQLAIQVKQVTGNVDRLANEVGELRFTVESIAQEAQQDRSQAAIDRAEFRTTVEQLLRVLTQQFNGNGHGE